MPVLQVLVLALMVGQGPKKPIKVGPKPQPVTMCTPTALRGPSLRVVGQDGKCALDGKAARGKGEKVLYCGNAGPGKVAYECKTLGREQPGR